MAAAERAIDEARHAGDEAVIGQALYVLSLTSYFLAKPFDGVEQARQAVQALDDAGSREWLGLAYWVLGLHSLLLGRFDEALEAERRVAAIADAIGDARLQSFAAFTTGWIHATLGQWDLAIEAGRRGVEVARDPISDLGARSYLGYAYLGKGDVETARPFLDQSLEGYVTARPPSARRAGDGLPQRGGPADGRDRARARACGGVPRPPPRGRASVGRRVRGAPPRADRPRGGSPRRRRSAPHGRARDVQRGAVPLRGGPDAAGAGRARPGAAARPTPPRATSRRRAASSWSSARRRSSSAWIGSPARLAAP